MVVPLPRIFSDSERSKSMLYSVPLLKKRKHPFSSSTNTNGATPPPRSYLFGCSTQYHEPLTTNLSALVHAVDYVKDYGTPREIIKESTALSSNSVMGNENQLPFKQDKINSPLKCVAEADIHAMKQKEHTRRGRWTEDEEQLVHSIVKAYQDGQLKLPASMSLRKFLAEVLNCNPMRISKKFPRMHDTLQKTGSDIASSIPNTNNETISKWSANYWRTSLPQVDSTLRRGRWLDEEHVYASAIVLAYQRGLFFLSQKKMTLRQLLAYVLQCDPMRISKKYAGNVPTCTAMGTIVETNDYLDMNPNSKLCSFLSLKKESSSLTRTLEDLIQHESNYYHYNTVEPTNQQIIDLIKEADVTVTSYQRIWRGLFLLERRFRSALEIENRENIQSSSTSSGLFPFGSTSSNGSPSLSSKSEINPSKRMKTESLNSIQWILN